MKTKLTLKDIAEKAGVSKTTASLCLNGKAEQYKIAKETQERIAAIIAENDYSPNLHARAILNNKTYLIGVVLAGNINQSFWFEILQGIEEVISREKYHMVLSLSHLDVNQELESLKFMKSKGVDGLIYSPVKGRGETDFSNIQRLAKNLPTISLTCKTDGIASVYMDNESGGTLAAQCLHDKGHRRVAYVGPTLPYDHRREGFINYYQSKGIKVDEYVCTDEFTAASHRYTAVFCFADHIVMNLYKSLTKAGIRIPDELSIIGYDNLEILNYLTPKPASINQLKRELGVSAAESLLAIINGHESTPGDIVFKPELIENDSIANLN